LHSKRSSVNTRRTAIKPRCALKLSEQLNKILETRDSARGLIVSMSDVLFDTGKYSLKPGAREKLAKVAGILIAIQGSTLRSADTPTMWAAMT
jgi:outer membrane protein OmpA-like peptidoglycan-associated protein